MPRYLFRVYGPNSGKKEMKKTTGRIYKDLNTEKAITQHAFLKINGKSAGHDSAAQIDDPETMIEGHVCSTTNIKSEFWWVPLRAQIPYSSSEHILGWRW